MWVLLLLINKGPLMNVGLVGEIRKGPSTGLKSVRTPLMNVGVVFGYP